jgi:SulP family sulfate permease
VVYLKRIFPFLEWPRPTAGSLRDDLLAGITVSLVAIPQALAYAQLSGVPAYYGLYAAFIPSIVGVLFGSSAILATGPVALTSLLTAASVGTLVPRGTEQFFAYVTLLALLSGLFQLGFGLARAGVLLSLVSHPVLMGFINAAALLIALSQLPALMGISARQTSHLLLDTWHVILSMDTLHEMSLAFGVAAMAMLLAFARFAPKLPGALITVAVLIYASYAVGFAGRGGRVVGSIPEGLPGFSVPPLAWEAVAPLLPAAFVIALVSFLEAMSSCRVIAIKTRMRWDQNQELIGQGLAKIAAAFCQSMPVSGSFSRSALNLASGAKTGLSSLVCSASILATLLFFTPFLFHLPKPVLAAMIILAVLNLVNVQALRHAWLASRDDGIAALVTFVATLAFAPNIQNGILTGIIVSLAAFLYRRMRPTVAVVSLHPDGTLRDAQQFDLPPVHPRIGALRFDAALYFANVSFFEDAVLKLEHDNPDMRYVLVVADGINLVDASGVEMLWNLAERLRQSGITLAFGGVKPPVAEVMERTGLAKVVGPENLFASTQAAVEALRERANSAS